VKWRDVRATNVFITHYPEFVEMMDDVWVVLGVEPSDDHDDYIKIRYSYLHNLGEPTSISEFSVDPESPIDYAAMFDEAVA